jgi:hypothetical protein
MIHPLHPLESAAGMLYLDHRAWHTFALLQVGMADGGIRSYGEGQVATERLLTRKSLACGSGDALDKRDSKGKEGEDTEEQSDRGSHQETSSLDLG